MANFSPLQIVALTPKTNCKQCGFPTCLAFAVSVINVGTPTSACPYIDQENLPEGLSAVAPMKSSEERDLELIAHLKGKIAHLDFSALAPKLGAAYIESPEAGLQFSYLGQQVILTKNGITINDEQPGDHRDQILLYNYIAQGGSEKPALDWIGMESLPNSISKIKTLTTYAEEPIARLFDRLAEPDIRSLLAAIGATASADSSAQIGAVVMVLPHVPQLLLFWGAEPEDNFEAKVKILFDHKVLDFLDLESLVFSSERLADRLKELSPQ